MLKGSRSYPSLIVYKSMQRKRETYFSRGSSNKIIESYVKEVYAYVGLFLLGRKIKIRIWVVIRITNSPISVNLVNVDLHT